MACCRRHLFEKAEGGWWAKAMAVETTTAERYSGAFRPSWRQIAAAATAVVLLLLGWAWLAPRIGLAWPYPQRLPDQIELRGFGWQRDDGCVRQPYELRGGSGGTLVPFGTIASALVFGGPQMFEAATAGSSGGGGHLPTDFYVTTGHGCYTEYSIVQGEPP